MEVDDLQYWRLCDELTVVQAALLVAGCNPSGMASYVERWPSEKRPPRYEAAKAAISHALRGGRIQGDYCEHECNGSYDEQGDLPIYKGAIDVESSTVFVGSLKVFLRDKGLNAPFFFPTKSAQVAYLDPLHPRYAPKLAAAVTAWLAFETEAVGSARSPKQQLVHWLRKNASEFGLTNGDGSPNRSGIEEVAKVANWKPSGGAPKTP